MTLAGGTPLTGPWGTVSSSNITPDDTGIKSYTEETFLQVLPTAMVNGQPLSPIIPVMAYKTRNDTDLKAIYSYLRSVPPVNTEWNNMLPPTECKLCRQGHGGGAKN